VQDDEMRATIMFKAAWPAVLMTVLIFGAGACEHTTNLQPLAPRTMPAASLENREMEGLLTAVQQETRAQGPADPARERLIAALFAAARTPVPQGSPTAWPAATVPAHVQHALSRLLASHGDPAAIASTLRELAGRDSRTP
jgi:hypothetical protein